MSDRKHKTILDAAVQVLAAARQPMSADAVYDEIVARGLYSFGAKDPRAILRGTLRKHIRTAANPRILQTTPGRYTVTS